MILSQEPSLHLEKFSFQVSSYSWFQSGYIIYGKGPHLTHHVAGCYPTGCLKLKASPNFYFVEHLLQSLLATVPEGVTRLGTPTEHQKDIWQRK